ncbi:Peroxisomal membrane protein 11B [Trichoplax sp. H2]|uniref:Peroxisomal membrane protein 11B n=1 Tax=Trichoplax adhaerens TaxID=10228 RepID=B3RS09_TRIAD|nr:expressed hypothetical protein [Trichoplax adhaerens]EDV26965.1 expressed hypothetical protein [Trichoplax adhaerens]RDD39031.1 Peroxisomal membrane protein 11B [Trichoplax sp. H2]|eukprot:XP_002110961.1 expressed hypothetical protein [Trichoplax adhaerens]
MSYAEFYVKYAAQTAGRDKLCRVVQYGSKIAAWLLEGNPNNAKMIEVINTLSTSLAMARKVFRIGKPIDEVLNAWKCSGLGDLLYKLTLTVSHVCRALYLFHDHLVWLAHVGVGSLDKKKITLLASRFWLAALITALLRDIYEMITLFFNPIKSRNTSGDTVKTIGFIPTLFGRRKDLLLDFIKNECDLWIPMTRLGYSNFSSGMIGVFGVISSLIGILVQINKDIKLSPS